MARCRKKHDFEKFQPLTFEVNKTTGLRERVMTEDEIKERQRKAANPPGPSGYWFTNIKWQRVCKKCGKVDWRYVNCFDVPDDDKVIKVKKTSGKGVPKKIKGYGRKLSIKDEKRCPIERRD